MTAAVGGGVWLPGGRCFYVSVVVYTYIGWSGRSSDTPAPPLRRLNGMRAMRHRPSPVLGYTVDNTLPSCAGAAGAAAGANASAPSTASPPSCASSALSLSGVRLL